MKRALFALAAFTLAASVFVAASASAQERIEFDRFYYFTDEPELLYLSGDIDSISPTGLLAALEANPAIQTLSLDSRGGEGAWAMVVADIIRSSQLDTIIPTGARCHSACSLLFFAGIGRQAFGDLGVHQESVDGHYYIQELLQARDNQLRCHGAAPEVMAIAAATPAAGMYIFAADEAARLGFDRTREAGLAAMGPARVTSPNPVPVDNSLLRATGGPLQATFQVSNNNNIVRTIVGTVVWGVVPNDTAPIVTADFYFAAIGVAIQIVFAQINEPHIPYYNLMMLIDVLSPEDNPPFPSIARVSFVDPVATGEIFSLQVPLPLIELAGAAVPTVLSATVLLALSEAEQLYLVFQGIPDTIIISFPKGDPGHQAFAEWMPATQLHVATTMPGNCTPFART